MNDNIFREYDIRGIYGLDLTDEVAYKIGQAFGSYISLDGQTKTIIGRDNRLSSQSLRDNLVAGIISTGIDVVDVGLVTSPMYYFAKKHHNFKTGIMITASHNPKEYNGFKTSFDYIGNAYGKYIQDFKNFVFKEQFKIGNGQIEIIDIEKEYINLIKNSLNIGSRKIKAVVDCGNGTGSIIIKKILDELNIDYKLMYCTSDGNFPNHQPDPTEAVNMVELTQMVKDLKFDIGLGIDGDADRIGIIDEFGNHIKSDLLMLIFYRNLCNKLKNRQALFDVKCSKTLIDELIKLNIEPVMYRTGNSYTNMMMQKGDFDFGGEYSGHLYFRDRFPGFDDGIYAGLRLIEILSNCSASVSDLLLDISIYESTPEIKIPVLESNKFAIVNKVKEYCKDKNYFVNDIDGVRVTFDDSWCLVRASNTGPNLTVRFEAETKERLEDIKSEFLALIEDLKNELS